MHEIRKTAGGDAVQRTGYRLAQANIDNGTLRVGVRADGALMPQEISPLTGITYLANGQDGLTPGCPCEAWGIADTVTNTSGFTGSSVGTTGITSESFTSTATTATSVANAFNTFRVTHAFAPSSATSNILNRPGNTRHLRASN